MMRVLYVHRGHDNSHAGAEAMTWQLAEALQALGHEVAVLVQGGGKRPATRAECNIYVLPTEEANADVWIGQTPFRPDMVHLIDATWPDYTRAALALARQLRAPFAITPASDFATWLNPNQSLATCREAGIVFVLTDEERRVLVGNGVPACRCVGIPQGGVLAGEPDGAGFRRRRGVSGAMVLFLGRKIRSKGYELLLESKVAVWRRQPATSFMLMGPRCDDDYERLLVAHSDPRVIDIGWVDEGEKHAALAACDLLCLPSTQDVFPLVVVEAWSCAKPVVVATFPGAREIVRDGVDGLVVAPTPESVAAGILSVLSDTASARRMGAAGLARVRRELSWEMVAKRVERAYVKVGAGVRT